MSIVKVHRAYWDYTNAAGIIKVHDPEIGVFGIMTDGTTFTSISLDDNTVRYYCQKYRKNNLGILRLGCDPNKDISYSLRNVKDDGLFYPDINLFLRNDGEKFFLNDGQPIIIYEYKELENLVF